MPRYELPKFSTEELLAAFGSRVSPAGVIKAGREGFKEGTDLASTIQDIKSKKIKTQQDIAEIERKLAAQELLAKTLEGKPEMERKKAALQPLAPKPLLTAPIVQYNREPAEGPATAEGKPASFVSPSREVMPMSPKTPEYRKGIESIQAEESKRNLLSTGVKAGLSADKAIEGLYPSDQLTRANAPQIFPFINNVTGERLTAMWNPITRQITAGDRVLDPTEWMRDYKPDLKTDPGTGELIRALSSGHTGGLTTGGNTHQSFPTGVPSQLIEFPRDLTVRQSDRLNELSKRFEDDEIVKSARISMATLQNLQTVQAQGSSALIGSLQSLRARGLAGEKGVLTEKDVERTTGSPKLSRRFWNALTKLAIGQENPENIAEFQAALQAVTEAAASRTQQVESDFIQRAVATRELSNVSPSLIRQNISIGTKPFPSGPVIEPDYNSNGIKGVKPPLDSFWK